MDVKLRVMAGKHAGKEIALVRPKFLIGRAEDCHLRAGSDLISRHHCVITIGDEQVTIKDFGSRNGTLVNDLQITGEQALVAGDHLKIGPLEFEVVFKTAEKAAEQPAPAATKPSTKPIRRATAQAAQGNHSVEDSISEWLGTPDPAAQTRSLSETRSFKTGNTDQIKVEPSAEASEEEATAEAPAAKKEPGKLPPVPQKPMAKDSREAAANILREMAKRR